MKTVSSCDSNASKQSDFEFENSKVDNNFSWFSLFISSALSLELNQDNQLSTDDEWEDDILLVSLFYFFLFTAISITAISSDAMGKIFETL